MQNPHQDSIICPKCSQSLKMTSIDQHIKDCPYTACQFCSEYYPTEVLNEHYSFCPARNRGQPGVQDMESSEEELQDMDVDDHPLLRQNSRTSQQFFHNDSDRSRTTMRTRPASNNMMQVRTIERVPGGFISRTMLVPMQNTPFGNLGMMRTLSGEEGHGEDEFFQQFMNHSNFIRLNRFLFIPAFLHQLLQQLANPNRGVEEGELNQLEKIKYQKPQNVKAGEEDKCTICITEFNDGEELRKLPCKHIFHPQCVDTWLVQNSHCPVCKLDVNTVLHR